MPVIALVLGLAASGVARSAPVSSAPTVAAADSGSGHPDYVAQVRANFTPRSRAYARTRTMLDFVEPLAGIAIALLLLVSRLSARMRDLAHRVSRRRYFRVLVYLVLFSLVTGALQFPLTWYEDFSLEHQYGLSNQSFLAWLIEQAKDLIVGVVVFGGLGLIALAYAAIAKSPRRWWLWLALGTLPVIVTGVLLEPLVIDPLYNQFVPLQDQQLRTRILALAAEAGIPARHVFQVDKSRQTKKLNAYVSGWGASQRIVLWDTTLQAMKTDEILFVMGHEMGHYRLAHIWKGILFVFALAFGLFYVSAVVMNAVVRRFGDRFGLRELSDIASLPLFAATLTLASMVALPLSNSFDRAIEHEADVFALELTHLNDAGARAFIELGALNRSDPEPSRIVEIFQYTHPPLIERIRFALGYRPWDRGVPNRFYRPRH